MTLAKLLETCQKLVVKQWIAREKQRQKDIAEFKVIDLARAMFDKEYAAELDRRFGKDWGLRGWDVPCPTKKT